MMAVFALHEDDWAMVQLLPVENLPFLRGELSAAARHGAEHWDGSGWTKMFLFGEPPHALNTRNIQATELKGGIFDYLISADELRTGYGGNLALEQSKSGFGFGTPYGDQGGIYGEQVSGVLRLLCLSGNWSGPVFADFLYDWGQRFELLLVDWWQNRVLLLNDRELILKVIDGDDDE